MFLNYSPIDLFEDTKALCSTRLNLDLDVFMLKRTMFHVNILHIVPFSTNRPFDAI